MTGTRYAFETSKFRFAVRSYLDHTKFVILLLKEDFGQIFWSGTYSYRFAKSRSINNRKNRKFSLQSKIFRPKKKPWKRLLRSFKKHFFRFFRNPSATAFSGFFRDTKTCSLNAVPLNAVGTVLIYYLNLNPSLVIFSGSSLTRILSTAGHYGH